MKPIAVIQHTEVGAPGTIIPILMALGREVQLVRIVDKEPVPTDPTPFGGIVFMGGYMSVHDALPWIPLELELIRQADAHDVPVAGHCLGAQLVALALGGNVRKLSQPEIGWRPIEADDSETAREWWGDDAGRRLQTFQWHGDTFEPPPGAQRIASSKHCSNQAFILRGMHFLVQSHLEMTPALVALSMDRNGEQLRRHHALANPAVSAYEDVLVDLDRRCSQMHRLLEKLYARWLQRCT